MRRPCLRPTGIVRIWPALGRGVVIGTRAVMYAPVAGPALFAILEDAAYQNMDGMMPYPQARGVMLLRAKSHGGVFVAMANARTPQSQWENTGPDTVETPVSGYSTTIHPLASPLADATLGCVGSIAMNLRVSLTRPSGARRIRPSACYLRLWRAAPICCPFRKTASVRLELCTNAIVRCAALPPDHCNYRPTAGIPHRDARWCRAAAINWKCPGCGHERMRVVRVGAAGTAAELAGLFRGVPVVLSSKTQGLVRDVARQPMIVIATPGFEPRVRPISAEQGSAGHEYRAVAVLDAWTSLYALGVDARLDTLTAWMRAVSLCAPRSRGGQALILGETDPVIAQSLMLWDSRILAAKDLEERVETGMPPAVAAACVWGRRDAVMMLMQRIGARAAIGRPAASCPACWARCRSRNRTRLMPGSSKPRPTG